MNYRLWIQAGLVLLTVLLPRHSLATQDWPEFRGPTGQGKANHVDPPLTWSQTENVAWKQTIPGKGWSSPIVYRDAIYVTTAREDTKRQPRSLCLLKLDPNTGKILWDVEVLAWSGRSPRQSKNSHASPTPIAENGRIYCHFGHMGSACVDENGKLLWAKQDEPYKPLHGTGSSPILYKNKLILNCDGQKDPFVLARDKHSGAVIWKTKRLTKARRKFSFCTPLIVRHNDRDLLVSVGSGLVGAYDPNNGKEIWRVDIKEGYSIVPRPVFGHGMVYVGSGFDRPGTVYAIRVDGQGDVTDSHIAWTKSPHPHTPSMLLDGSQLYYTTDKGVAYCVDATTGTPHWQQALGQKVKASASPVLAGDRIYQTLENGTTVVFKAGKVFEKLAENSLDEYTLASPALSGSKLYIRTETLLYCLTER